MLQLESRYRLHGWPQTAGKYDADDSIERYNSEQLNINLACRCY